MRQEAPDEDRKVSSHSALFASELTGNVSPATCAAAAPAAPPNPARSSSSSDFVDNLRVRRRSSRSSRRVLQISEPTRAQQCAWPDATSKTDAAVPGLGCKTILATSRAGQGTEPVADEHNRMVFKGLRARVQGAKETSGEDGESQVEARTPPAMERNLFLSALANGKLEVIVGMR